MYISEFINLIKWTRNAVQGETRTPAFTFMLFLTKFICKPNYSPQHGNIILLRTHKGSRRTLARSYLRLRLKKITIKKKDIARKKAEKVKIKRILLPVIHPIIPPKWYGINAFNYRRRCGWFRWISDMFRLLWTTCKITVFSCHYRKPKKERKSEELRDESPHERNRLTHMVFCCSHTRAYRVVWACTAFRRM